MTADIIVSIGFAALGGAIRSALGFVDAKRDKPDMSFNWGKFLQSIVRGAIIGIGSVSAIQALGVDLTPIADYFASIVSGVAGDAIVHDIGLKK